MKFPFRFLIVIGAATAEVAKKRPSSYKKFLANHMIFLTIFSEIFSKSGQLLLFCPDNLKAKNLNSSAPATKA